MNKKQRKWRNRILVALALFAVIFATEHLLPLADMLGSEAAAVYLLFALYLVPYLIAGHDVLLQAARNIKNGQVFDENLLMAIATIGAFAISVALGILFGLYPAIKASGLQPVVALRAD